MIEPLRVVDHTEQGLLIGGGRHQAQHCQPDEETIRRWSDAAAESHGESFTLRFGQFIDVIHQWRAKLLKAGECQLHIGLNARHLDAAEIQRQLRQVLEQCGLADTRLPADHQHLAATRLNG